MESLSPPSSPAVSPASLFPWLENNEDKTITGISGRKCYELYQNYIRLGSLVKTCLVSSVWGSMIASLTWKVKATPSNRLLLQLVPSTLRTDETGSGFLPTLMASEWKLTGDLVKLKKPSGHHLKLTNVVCQEDQPTGNGSLSPQWLESFMGYPTGWTDLKD